jgi:hypothetical protein
MYRYLVQLIHLKTLPYNQTTNSINQIELKKQSI